MRTACLAASLPLLWAGCSVRVDFGGSSFACPDGKTCPSGQECIDFQCVATPGGGDGGQQDGGGGDAPADLRCGGTSLLADDFSDVEPDPRLWIPYEAGGASLTETGGQALISLVSAPGNRYAGAFSRDLFDLRDGRVFVEAVEAPSSNTNAQMYLDARADAGETVEILKELDQLLLIKYTSGVPEYLASLPYDPQAHRYWSLREAAGTIYYETSSDGRSWQVGAEMPNPFDVSLVELDFGAGTYQNETNPGQAVFAGFGGGTPSGARCPTSSLSDDFEDGIAARTWAGSWADPGCTTVETNGQVTFTPPATAPGYCGYETGAGYLLDTVTMEVAEAALNGAETFLHVEDLGTGFVEFVLDSGTGQLIARSMGDVGEVAGSTSYSSLEHRFWRLRVDGDTLTFETSPDGTAWNQLMSTGVAIDISAVHVSFGAGSNVVVATPGQASFGAFNP